VNLAEYVAYWVERLEGPDSARAFHSLEETNSDVIPFLVDAYHREKSNTRRAAIVELVWQHRDSAALPFLAAALREDHERIWQQALDGLVTLGDEDALDALVTERASLSVSEKKADWIDEAIEQIGEQSV
jgi:HEAT repeat protein